MAISQLYQTLTKFRKNVEQLSEGPHSYFKGFNTQPRIQSVYRIGH